MSSKSIRSQHEFNLIHRKGTKYRGVFFSLHILRRKGADEPRFGIVVGLKVSKSAVERNKKRRQIREIIRQEKSNIERSCWGIVMVYEKALQASYIDLEKEFESLCRKARILHQ